MLFCACALSLSLLALAILRMTSLGQVATLVRRVIACATLFLFIIFCLNSVIQFEIHVVINLTFRAFHLF
jgi:hypothetical protein